MYADLDSWRHENMLTQMPVLPGDDFVLGGLATEESQQNQPSTGPGSIEAEGGSNGLAFPGTMYPASNICERSAGELDSEGDDLGFQAER